MSFHKRANSSKLKILVIGSDFGSPSAFGKEAGVGSFLALVPDTGPIKHKNTVNYEIKAKRFFEKVSKGSNFYLVDGLIRSSYPLSILAHR